MFFLFFFKTHFKSLRIHAPISYLQMQKYTVRCQLKKLPFLFKMYFTFRGGEGVMEGRLDENPQLWMELLEHSFKWHAVNLKQIFSDKTWFSLSRFHCQDLLHFS